MAHGRATARSTATLAAVSALLLSVAACTGTGAPSPSPPPSAADSESAELVDIGGGREMYLKCAGSGSPTVLFISGTRGAADEWDTLREDAQPNAVSTFDAVSRTTRACAYDRPGTTLASGELSPSTATDQPTSARDGSEDVKTLLAAADQPGPYVVVGLSWGGMIAQDFARTQPADVVGLVLLESASTYLVDAFSPDQWARWMALVAESDDAIGSEVPAYQESVAQLQAAAQPGSIPTVVISADHPWDLQVTPGESTWTGWVAAQAQLAQSLHAEHITKTDSGHGLPLEQPALITAAILEVVDAVRTDSAAG